MKCFRVVGYTPRGDLAGFHCVSVTFVVVDLVTYVACSGILAGDVSDSAASSLPRHALMLGSDVDITVGCL